MPSPYLNQYWNIVNLNIKNKIPWNIDRNWNIYIQENAFENVVWKIAAFLSRSECVNFNADFARPLLKAGHGWVIIFPISSVYDYLYKHNLNVFTRSPLPIVFMSCFSALCENSMILDNLPCWTTCTQCWSQSIRSQRSQDLSLHRSPKLSLTIWYPDTHCHSCLHPPLSLYMHENFCNDFQICQIIKRIYFSVQC